VWDNVDKAMEKTLSCHMQYESTNLKVNNNEPNINNAVYYLILLT